MNFIIAVMGDTFERVTEQKSVLSTTLGSIKGAIRFFFKFEFEPRPIWVTFAVLSCWWLTLKVLNSSRLDCALENLPSSIDSAVSAQA